MTNERIMQILNVAKEQTLIGLTIDDDDDFVEAVHYCYDKNLLKKPSNAYMLTSLGIDVLDGRISLDDAISPKRGGAVHIGHNISGAVHASNLSSSIDNSINSNSKNVQENSDKEKKKSALSLVLKILAGLASIATIWGVLHAMSVTIKF